MTSCSAGMPCVHVDGILNMTALQPQIPWHGFEVSYVLAPKVHRRSMAVVSLGKIRTSEAQIDVDGCRSCLKRDLMRDYRKAKKRPGGMKQ